MSVSGVSGVSSVSGASVASERAGDAKNDETRAPTASAVPDAQKSSLVTSGAEAAPEDKNACEKNDSDEKRAPEGDNGQKTSESGPEAANFTDAADPVNGGDDNAAAGRTATSQNAQNAQITLRDTDTPQKWKVPAPTPYPDFHSALTSRLKSG